jgi:membrane dipeptidase
MPRIVDRGPRPPRAPNVSYWLVADEIDPTPKRRVFTSKQKSSTGKLGDPLKERDDSYMQIKTTGDFEAAKEVGKLAKFYNFQSMNAFGEEIGNVEKYYDLGLRTANFTYNVDNAYAGGSTSNDDGSNDGLTELGRKFVVEMNRVGMVVDCSHSSNQTCIEAATLTTKPMVMSHSNVATLQPIGRNASDKAIKAVAATGGVICINFIGGFLNPQGDARPMSIAKHMEYVKKPCRVRSGLCWIGLRLQLCQYA